MPLLSTGLLLTEGIWSQNPSLCQCHGHLCSLLSLWCSSGWAYLWSESLGRSRIRLPALSFTESTVLVQTDSPWGSRLTACASSFFAKHWAGNSSCRSRKGSATEFLVAWLPYVSWILQGRRKLDLPHLISLASSVVCVIPSRSYTAQTLPLCIEGTSLCKLWSRLTNQLVWPDPCLIRDLINWPCLWMQIVFDCFFWKVPARSEPL